MSAMHTIDGAPLTAEAAYRLLDQRSKLTVTTGVRDKVAACRTYLEGKLADTGDAFYGINTGFGVLCDHKISPDDLVKLQHNLVRSHACGMGDRVPDDISRLILFLKIQNMSLGHSGVRPALVDRMLDLFNAGVVPTIFQLGSLGASGDLAPLAHLGLTIIGEDASSLSMGTFELREKEGLAILNGTQFSLAYAVANVGKALRLCQASNMIAALSMEAFLCDNAPYHEAVHAVRAQHGQVHTAAEIRRLRSDSPLSKVPKQSVQDPYSFRCVPQVHGASLDAIRHSLAVIERELNSVTDNPLIFPDQDLILSGGNFHAQPLALALDQLAIATAELGSISERRIYQLINGERDLPYFLVDDAGINSGFMITQYTAASIASQNKQLCTPASVDSIISCKGQEDHVSMAANAATKCYQVVNNLARILSLELMVAAQALEYRRPLQSSPEIEELVAGLRAKVSRYDTDRTMHTDIINSEAYLAEVCRSIDVSSLQAG